MSTGIYFKNCSVPEEFESYANICLSRVIDLAPYGATALAVVEQANEKISGYIEVCSSWGPFFVSAVGHDMKIIVDQLMEKMQEKLQTWHARCAYGQAVEAPMLTQ
jgi:hypothetical protein